MRMTCPHAKIILLWTLKLVCGLLLMGLKNKSKNWHALVPLDNHIKSATLKTS